MVTNPSTIRSILRVFTAAAVAIAVTASAQAQSTWTGATDDQWGTAGNWSANGAPPQTGTVQFTSSATQTTVNSPPRSDFGSLVFQSGALAYTINGGVGIRGTPGTITVDSGVSNNQIISGNVRNGAGTTSTITNNGTGLLNFTGQFFSGGTWTVTFDGSGGLLVNGANGGSGLVTVANAARIGGTGSLAGGLTIAAGGLFAFNPADPTLDVSGVGLAAAAWARRRRIVPRVSQR